MGQNPLCMGSVLFGFYDYQRSVRFEILLVTCYLLNNRSVQISSVHFSYPKCEIREMEKKNKFKKKIKKPSLLGSVLFGFFSYL